MKVESDNDGNVVYIVDHKYGKSSTYEFNADLELLLNKLFLHLALANGITYNPAKLCS
jgi:hypothetical protein